METETEPEVKKIPKFGDLEWHDYVIGHFTPDELFEGNPKVDGMWRVAELLLGEITDYSSKVVEAPSEKNGFCATAEAHITIRKKEQSPTMNNFLSFDSFLKASGVGDCNFRNADQMFARFPSSLAETRAKARALRTILRLRNVVSAEELVPTSIDQDGTDEPSTETQRDTYELLCEKLDVNAGRFLTQTCVDNNYVFKSFKKVHGYILKKCIKKLNGWMSKKDQIPDDLKGYMKGWIK